MIENKNDENMSDFTNSQSQADDLFNSEVGNKKSLNVKRSKKWLFWLILLMIFIFIGLLLKIFLGGKKNSDAENDINHNPVANYRSIDTSRVSNFVDDNIVELPVINEPPQEENEPVISNDENKVTSFSEPEKPLISKSMGSMVIVTSKNKGKNNSNKDEFEDLDFMKPAKSDVVKASYLAIDPTFLLQKGTYINCSLRTKLVTTVQGNLGCVVTDDIYSANGTVLLIEKGSTVFGSFKSGQLKNGQSRLYVIWNEIRTPNNIIIPISSESTDTLGGAGIEGWVDNHWVERFGSAILLSAIDDTIGALSDRLRKTTYDSTENTREATQKMANTTLEKMIDIEPTLYRNHGDLVGIFVNKDIDFSDVYKLELK